MTSPGRGKTARSPGFSSSAWGLTNWILLLCLLVLAAFILAFPGNDRPDGPEAWRRYWQVILRAALLTPFVMLCVVRLLVTQPSGRTTVPLSRLFAAALVLAAAGLPLTIGAVLCSLYLGPGGLAMAAAGSSLVGVSVARQLADGYRWPFAAPGFARVVAAIAYGLMILLWALLLALAFFASLPRC
jgi:hypothetical protein